MKSSHIMQKGAAALLKVLWGWMWIEMGQLKILSFGFFLGPQETPLNSRIRKAPKFENHS